MAATNSRIVKTAGVCGGDACLRGTRYTVWGLVESRMQGATDEQILRAHPSLTMDDLQAAWKYYREHALEIDRALWENTACMVQYDAARIPIEVIQRGRELGFSDDEIRDAFDPPLPQGWQQSREMVPSEA